MSLPKRLIVPVFIPHEGCPHVCVFCNQKKISGTNKAPSPGEVRDYLSSRLGPETPHAVIAFYGGSFTGLPREEQD
ncbi:MAG TPA: radical SAM protein, partial [Nitrospirota bacterium]|nr:radical SAM protein [Nitrospirota bacterium]